MIGIEVVVGFRMGGFRYRIEVIGSVREYLLGIGELGEGGCLVDFVVGGWFRCVVLVEVSYDLGLGWGGVGVMF